MKERLIIYVLRKRPTLLRKSGMALVHSIFISSTFHVHTYIFQFLVHNMNVDIPIDVRSHFFLRSKYRVLSQ